MNPDIKVDIPTGFYNVSLLTDEDLDQIFENPKQGIYFLPGRSGKGWFHRAVAKSSAMVLLRADTQNSVLLAIGEPFAQVLEKHKYLGFLVRTHVD